MPVHFVCIFTGEGGGGGGGEETTTCIILSLIPHTQARVRVFVCACSCARDSVRVIVCA